MKTSTAAKFLEPAFDALNVRFFENALSKPVITIQSTPNAYGHCSVNEIWKEEGGEARREINLGDETLNRPVENTLATLVHEMVHLYNMQKGVQDCSRGNTYHNRKFKEEAEKRGLIIEFDKRIGWSLTTPAPLLIDFIKERGWEKLDMFRDYNGWKGAGTGKKPSSTRKYTCPVCGQSIRATKEVNVICGDCMVKMVTEGDSGDDESDAA
jgi:hypothetical protein